jgi:hypothetical protein
LRLSRNRSGNSSAVSEKGGVLLMTRQGLGVEETLDLISFLIDVFVRAQMSGCIPNIPD